VDQQAIQDAQDAFQEDVTAEAETLLKQVALSWRPEVDGAPNLASYCTEDGRVFGADLRFYEVRPEKRLHVVSGNA
jgi:hypothetical protein